LMPFGINDDGIILEGWDIGKLLYYLTCVKRKTSCVKT